MSAPEGTGSGHGPSLFASLRSFWSVVVAILYTRLDLVTAELEDEATRGVKLLLAGVVAIIGFTFAFFFLNYFIIACAWNTPYRLLTIGIIFGVYLLIGIIAAMVARNMIVGRPRFLSQTLAELRRDVEGLRQVVATKQDEPQPKAKP
jgi:uncharacterized membrane protein YqjE